MNNETSKTSTPAAASPLTAKPDLVKNIGGTTFDIHIHFSETSRETFTDKVVRLIKKPLKSKILFSCSLLTKPEGHHLTGGRRPAGAQAIPYQKSEPYQFQKIHEIQSPGVYPQ